MYVCTPTLYPVLCVMHTYSTYSIILMIFILYCYPYMLFHCVCVCIFICTQHALVSPFHCAFHSIMDAREFEWESQLRFYWEKDLDELTVWQCTGSFGYGYEYMGLNGRLVITPLTDRIYLTLTQVRYTTGTYVGIRT